MSLEPCKTGPCPFIKTAVVKPQQPFRCYNCQQRRISADTPKAPMRIASCDSSVGSSDSNMTKSSMSSIESPTSPKLYRFPTAPLPGVALQPKGTLSYCSNASTPRPKSAKNFVFACSSSSHYCTPHYANLPSFLPHQNHPCPPCQLEGLKAKGDAEAVSSAKAEFPLLRGEMLVRNGRIREDWQSNLTLDKYVAEKRTDERQMWHHVTAKWTQDLKKLNVLVSEEDGLGLLS